MNEIYLQWLKERPRYKHLREWKTGIVPQIIKAYQSTKSENKGNVSRVITGDAGIGKSTYSYKLLAKVHYTLNGYTTIDQEEDSYRFALDNMLYRPQELFERVERTLSEDKQDLMWCVDDASIHMGRQLFDQDRQAYRRLQGTVPTLRENVAGLLLTTIEIGLLAKPLREFVKVKAHVTATQSTRDYARLARHYNKWYFPDDVKFRIGVLYQEAFSCLVPEPFYSWYHDKKIRALREYNETVKNWRPVVKGDEPTEEDADT